eukprot:TRINITY_DN832_c0_g1_i2.p1 TRINITY_DN832_c0_g1~~TRINITY_DN832_c0_g1_i2.p1  ORF type:complete len:149 (+),score=9.07 TRINITY_DN832_c0_g1_i2:166-612(+)
MHERHGAPRASTSHVGARSFTHRSAAQQQAPTASPPSHSQQTPRRAPARHPWRPRSAASRAPTPSPSQPLLEPPAPAKAPAPHPSPRPPPPPLPVYFAGPPAAAAAASPPAACLRYFSIKRARGLARSPRVTLERGRTVLRCTAHDTQ